MNVPRFAVSDAHDNCDKEEHQKSESSCRELSHEYLPSRTAEISHDLSAQDFLLPLDDLSFVQELLFRLTSTKPPGSDPPVGLLSTKLRI